MLSTVGKDIVYLSCIEIKKAVTLSSMNFLLRKAGLKKKKKETEYEDTEDGSNNYCAAPGMLFL